ncbi:MAG: phage tail tape measure protein [Coriobacteriales bacterium]|jgi:TP901 family phage tail tape measure protein|nr:phage tail tape measure protein [Coriobacteriales bacterium]
MAGSYTKGISIVLDGNTTKLNDAIKGTQKTARQLGTELNVISRGLSFNPSGTDLLTAKQTTLQGRIKLARQELEQLVQAEGQMEQKLASGQIDDGAMDRYRADVSMAENKIKDFNAQLVKVQIELERTQTWHGKAGTGLVDFANKASGSAIESGKALSYTLTPAVLAMGKAALDSATAFESSFAGVRKTVDATETEFDALASSAKAMSETKVVSAAQVSDIMALGGQLGISTENLTDFAAVVADLDVATNLNAEQAATQLAQFANITGMAQTDTERFASTLVALGNNSATTESAIMDMGMRIAGAGSQMGLTDVEILALSASLSSVGITAEAGGTAISTVLSSIDKEIATNGEKLQIWADTAGMSVDDFKTAWEGDALGTFTKIMQGMSESADAGGNLTVVLDELGVSSIRQTDMMKRLAGASDILTQSVGTANTAWDENTALTKEAEARYQTVDSQMQMLKNQFSNAMTTLGEGLLPTINEAMSAIGDLLKGALDAYSSLDDTGKGLANGFLLAAGAAGPVTLAAGKIVEFGKGTVETYRKMSDELAVTTAKKKALKAATEADTVAEAANTTAKKTNATATAGATGATSAATTATKLNSVATAAHSAATGAATVATTAFGKAANLLKVAWATNPIGIIVTAVSLLLPILATVIPQMAELASGTNQLTESSQKQKDEVERLTAKYDEFSGQEKELSAEAKAVKAELDAATEAFEDNKMTVGELSEAVKKTVEDYAAFREEAQGTLKALGSSSTYVDGLVERYAQLAEKQERSAGEEAEMLSLAKQLADAVPDIGQAYDETTGKINLTAQEVRKLANAELERAKQSALTDLITEAYKTEQEAIRDLKVAEDELARAEAERAEQQDIANETLRMTGYYYEVSTKAVDDAQAAVDSFKSTIGGARSQQNDYNQLLQNSTLITSRFGDALTDNGLTADELTAKLADTGLSVVDLGNVTKDYTYEAGKGFVDANGEVVGSLDEVMVKMADEKTAAQQWAADNIAAYTKTRDAGAKAYVDYLVQAGTPESQAALEALKSATVEQLELAAAAFTKATDDGAKAFVNYLVTHTTPENEAALKGLAGMTGEQMGLAAAAFSKATDDGAKAFVNYLVTHTTPENEAALKGLAGMTSGQLNEIAARWETSGTAGGSAYVKNLASGLSSGKKSTRDNMQALVDERKNVDLSGADALGRDVGLGITGGVGKISLAPSLKAMIDKGIVDTRIHLESNSPSRLFAKKVGNPISQGVALGIAQEQGDVESAMGDMIDGAIKQTSKLQDIALSEMQTKLNFDLRAYGRLASLSVASAPQSATVPNYTTYNLYLDGNLIKGDPALMQTLEALVFGLRRTMRAQGVA